MATNDGIRYSNTLFAVESPTNNIKYNWNNWRASKTLAWVTQLKIGSVAYLHCELVIH